MICNHGEGVVCLRCHDELRAVHRDYHNEHMMRVTTQEALGSVQDELTAARARIAELEETLSSSYDDVESMNACLERYEKRIFDLEAAQQWRPMETAPRINGGQVRVRNRRWATEEVAEWDEHRKEWFIPATGIVLRPTHWLPMTPPPKEEQ